MNCKVCKHDTPVKNVVFKIKDSFCSESCRLVYSMLKAKHYLKKSKCMVVMN